jgi:hypothetical protein
MKGGDGTGTRMRLSKRQILKRILRRAAAKEELDTEGEITSIDKTPFVIAFSLLLRGLVRPMDVAVVACFTTYFIVLNMAAQSTRDMTGAPILPATPPQGHVPTLITNPLGLRTEQSTWYDMWLKTGVIVGFLGPIGMVFYYAIMKSQMEPARICARPLFLLSCQIVTEAISKRNLVRYGTCHYAFHSQLLSFLLGLLTTTSLLTLRYIDTVAS